MGKFKSINYIQVNCEGCGASTSVEPGTEFSELNCDCKDEPPRPALNDTEISKPVQLELDYKSTLTVTVIGRFKDGDYEVCSGNDLSDTWRVPKDTFESTYEELSLTTEALREFSVKIADALLINEEVRTDETPETDADNKQEITLSLEDIKGKTPEEIAEAYSLEELRILAKAQGMRNVDQTGEVKLIGKLLKKAE